MEAFSISNVASTATAKQIQSQTTPARLLIVCNDTDMEQLKDAMAEEPWLLEYAHCATDAAELMRTASFDAALIDPSLPDHKDLYWLPSAGIPIIIISNPTGDQETLAGFMPQAADFIFKPFCAPELKARIKKILGQSATHPRTYHSANFYLDAEQRHCTVFNKSIQLTAHETELLIALLDSPRQFCTNQQLIEQIWGRTKPVETQNLRVLVAQLRKKIEPHPHNPEILLTIFGVGYRLLLP